MDFFNLYFKACGGKMQGEFCAWPLNTSWFWAVDAPGSASDAWAIDVASAFDANWAFRAEAG